MNADERQEWLCMIRNVETPCKTCGGAGVTSYGSTSTWRGGAGGQQITSDVCDRCWGTGDEYRRGTSYRDIEQWKASHERERVSKIGQRK